MLQLHPSDQIRHDKVTRNRGDTTQGRKCRWNYPKPGAPARRHLDERTTFRALHACHALPTVDAGKVKRWRSTWAWDNVVQKGWRTYRTARMSRTPTEIGAQLLYNDRSWTRRSNLMSRTARMSRTPTEVGFQLVYLDRSRTCNAGNARNAR